LLQGAAERTPQFGRGIASGEKHIQWCRERRQIALYVPFLMYTMAWLEEHRVFIVEEFIKNCGSLVATQRAFRIRFALGRREFFLPHPVQNAVRMQRYLAEATEHSVSVEAVERYQSVLRSRPTELKLISG